MMKNKRFKYIAGFASQLPLQIHNVISRTAPPAGSGRRFFLYSRLPPPTLLHHRCGFPCYCPRTHTAQSEQLIDMERSNIQSRLARQYEIQQYKYEGEIPQDIKELSDEEGPMDRPDDSSC